MRTDWPSTNPASQSGYQSSPASSALGARPPVPRVQQHDVDVGARAQLAGARTSPARPPPTAARPRPRRERRAATSSTQRRPARRRTPSPRQRRDRRRAGSRAARACAAHRAALQSASGPDLSGADAPDVLDRHDPHLAVADLAGARGRERAAATTRSTSPSSTRISIRTFGTKSIVYSAPRYTSVCPRWRPKPCTSVTVRPCTPSSLSASFTSSTLNGLMIADDQLH